MGVVLEEKASSRSWGINGELPRRTISSLTINLEIGHDAYLRKKLTPEGYTHDWEVFVRGCNGADIKHYVEKVVFHLHETFENPKRVVKEPPYSVKTSGYAGFDLPIEIYLKHSQEPRKISFTYDLRLQSNGPPIHDLRKEKYTFYSVNKEFQNKLLKGGAVVPSSPQENVSKSTSKKEDQSQNTSKPKPDDSDQGKKFKLKTDESQKTSPKLGHSSNQSKKFKLKAEEPKIDQFIDLFGTPIITKTKGVQEVPKNEEASKFVIKPNDKDKDKSSDKDKNKTKSSDNDCEKCSDGSSSEGKSGDNKKDKKEKKENRKKDVKEMEKEKDKSSLQKIQSPASKRSLKRHRSPSAVERNVKDKDVGKDKENDSREGNKEKKFKMQKEKDNKHRDEDKEKVKENQDSEKPEETKSKENEKVKSEEKPKHKHNKKDRKEKKRQRKEKNTSASSSLRDKMELLFGSSPKSEPSASPVLPNLESDHLFEDNSSNASKVSSRESSSISEPSVSPRSDVEGPLKSIPFEGDAEFMSRLRRLQTQIMEMDDPFIIRKVVELISETGTYEFTEDSFDCDLCLLDKETLTQLLSYFSL